MGAWLGWWEERGCGGEWAWFCGRGLLMGGRGYSGGRSLAAKVNGPCLEGVTMVVGEARWWQ